MKTCDSIDGVEDGLIENPLACTFDIESLLCGLNDTNCLTGAQIDAARAIYEGPLDACDGEQIYPGFSLGSESEWSLQQGPLASLFAVPILQNLVYDDLAYDASSFQFGADVLDVDERAGSLIDERSEDISGFRDRGGKLIVTQGWTDAFNAATWPILYLEQVEDFFQDDVSDFFTLFMIPGGGHCGAAAHHPDVPAVYHTMTKLVQWVEQGIKPQYVLSTNPPDGSSRTRKLCPWPSTASFTSGNQNESTSYTCT